MTGRAPTLADVGTNEVAVKLTNRCRAIGDEEHVGFAIHDHSGFKRRGDESGEVGGTTGRARVHTRSEGIELTSRQGFISADFLSVVAEYNVDFALIRSRRDETLDKLESA